MIRDMFNLRCPKGHQHYSPTPEKFVGATCMTPLEKTTDARGRKCQERLKRIRKP